MANQELQQVVIHDKHRSWSISQVYVLKYLVP